MSNGNVTSDEFNDFEQGEELDILLFADVAVAAVIIVVVVGVCVGVVLVLLFLL